jgi:hypothetical protein
METCLVGTFAMGVISFSISDYGVGLYNIT